MTKLEKMVKNINKWNKIVENNKREKENVNKKTKA